VSLALTHAAAHQPFNGLFYATCATIIPVLYIVLAIQGSTLPALLRQMTISENRLNKMVDNASKGRDLGPYLAQLTRAFAVGIAFTLIWYPAGGAILALIALYHGHASPLDAQLALAAAATLTVAILFAPLISFATSQHATSKPTPPKWVRQAHNQSSRNQQNRPRHTPENGTRKDRR